ncbi:MAG: hypothetical protein ABIQ02_01605, partial [Saprospiraceae bacterium]
MPIQRLPVHFDADPKKVILLYLDPGESERLGRFSEFVSNMSDQEADEFYKQTTTLFERRHRKLNETIIEHAKRGMSSLNTGHHFSEKQ